MAGRTVYTAEDAKRIIFDRLFFLV